MGNNVYSLVLNDEVISLIDRAAYLKSTSRSALINRILAEYVSYVTPEERMRRIFDRIGMLLSPDGTLQAAEAASESMMTLRSALSYKYNPTVRYTVTLYRNRMPEVGELRIGFRTQNSGLLDAMDRFFAYWIRVEEKYVSNCEYLLERGKMTRKLVTRKQTLSEVEAEETMGDVITEYIRLFDEALKLYFAYIDRPETASVKIEALYRDYIKESREIL